MRGSLLSKVAVIGCTLIVGGAVGVGAAYALLSSTTPDTLKPSDELSSIQVTMQAFDDPRSVELTAEVLPPSSITVTRSGTITTWSCTTGTELTSGESSVAVDGVSLLNLATGVPLWRDLAPGAEGTDVEAVENELVRLGKPAKADAFLSWAEMVTIDELAKAAGVRLDGTLPRDLVVWLPAPRVTVDSCEKGLGATVSPSETVAQVDSGIVLSSVPLPEGRIPGARNLNLLPEPVPLGEGGELPADLNSSTIRDSSAFREAASGAPEASVLTLKGRIVLQEPVQVAAVPATAVLVDSDGATCVFTNDTEVRVTVVGSEFGSSFILFESAEPPAEIDALKSNHQASCT